MTDSFLPPMTQTDDNRTKQIAIAAGILGTLALAVCGALIGWRYLPGILGEWIGTMVGVMTTPFLLEGSFVVIGLTLVVAINHWRQKRAGDELVYLEQVDGAADTVGLPEHAKWAVYREAPLEGIIPSLQTQAEGALAIGDYDSAVEILGAMPEQELTSPEGLALRLELAKATGRAQLAAELEKELRRLRNDGN